MLSGAIASPVQGEVGRPWPSRWGCLFSGDLKLYRCVYCGCPTGSCRPNRKKRAGNARPYVIDFCSDYARRGDHWSPVVQVLPEATPQSATPPAPLTQGSQGGRLTLRQRFATPQSAAPTAPLTQGSNGKCGAKSAPQYREAAAFRFRRQFRYRADAINVSVGASVRL